MWVRDVTRFGSLLLCLAGPLVAVAACRPSREGPPEVAGGPAAGGVPVATAGPMTGQYARFGEQMRRGAEMAVRDINAEGGVDGGRLALTIGDDACDPRQAVAVADRFVRLGVRMVAGHFCSSSSIPASAVYDRAGVVQITPASTNPKLTEQSFSNVFRTCGRDDAQGTFAADYVVDHKLGDKVAIVQDQSQYGESLADAFRKEFDERGAKELAYEAVSQGDKDFGALITKLKSLGVKLIYYGGYHTEAGLLVRRAHEQGLDATLVSGDALVDRQFWSIAGDSGEGTLMTFAPDPRKLPSAADVVKEFEAEGYDPEGYTLYTYAAIQAFAAAAARAGSGDPGRVGKALHLGSFDTVLGPIGFDERGDVAGGPKYVMYRWSGGRYAEVGG